MAYKIGLDIDGGDFAPVEIIKGANLALEEINDKIILLGNEREIKDTCNSLNIDMKKFDIVHAEEKISMDESPAYAVRRKKKSSIVMGTKMLKDKKIDAFVSCGNTGAVVCASTLNVGLIKGVERPGIAVLLPTLKGVSLLIDVGANIDPKPLHLFQYGLMASVYYSLVLGESDPTVSLLNIGEEETKGGELIRHTHRLFSYSSLNFKGNIEAKDIFYGESDCIVCDGFTGNVALKVSEGLASVIGKFLLDFVKQSFFAKIGLLLIKNSLKNFKQLTDYAEYGGAPLLGVDGVVIIGHGRSQAVAVKNALHVAIKELNRDLNDNIGRKINEIGQDCGSGQIRAS